MFYRFLIIDNNQIERNLYQAILFHHYKHSAIDFADNGVAALEKCSANNYSAIISTIEMPLMNGIDFFEKLKATSPLIAKKTIFVSSNIETYKSSFFKENDCPAMEKPFKKSKLLQLIDIIIEREEKRSGRQMSSSKSDTQEEKAKERAL